jgi:hypothetical protein
MKRGERERERKGKMWNGNNSAPQTGAINHAVFIFVFCSPSNKEERKEGTK